MARQLTAVLRPFAPVDAPAVIEVINADRLPGQPLVTQATLAQALAGRSPVDSGWWADLTGLTTEVAIDPAGDVVGVVSFARRDHDRVGVLLWLHARERREVVTALVDHALGRLAGCREFTAFEFASALGLGLEALPVRSRPVTDAVLVERGFVGTDLWRYMRRDLPAPELPRAATFTVEAEDDRRHLRVRDDARRVLAETTIGIPHAGVGVLWWLHVEAQARGQGLGAGLLGSALDLLSGLGAQEVILYVDDDEPGADRDRGAANRLYDRAGFVEIDRLYSYRL
jgi:ribosomal protein S18 acetylase RimI-like enzyme